MSVDNTLCIYPLVESLQSPYLISDGALCGISCADRRDFFIFFTREEDKILKTIILVVCLATISLTPLYVSVAISERCRSEKSCLALPFAYQCPFFISSGYILTSLIALSPFLFGPLSIICNSGENTLTMASFQNIPCSFTAIGVYLGIRLAVLYTCALSISLALTLYHPTIVQRKRYFHLVIWGCIGIGIIPLVMLKSITGDYYFGICTTSLTSRIDLLVLDIIPLVSCVFIFSTSLLLASLKVFRRDTHVVQLLAVDKDVSSLFNRLMCYNLLQTTSVVVLVGDFCYWYINLDAWSETVMATFICEMGKTRTNQTSPHDYEICIEENADLPKPSLWTYYIFHICALISVLGAIVFQCSLRVQQRSMNILRSSSASLMNVCTCRMCRRRRPRNPISATECVSSSIEIKREEIGDTTIISSTAIISSLDSTTSIQAGKTSE